MIEEETTFDARGANSNLSIASAFSASVQMMLLRVS